MKKRAFLIFWIVIAGIVSPVLAGVLTPATTQSKTIAYISDTLEVPLRAGASSRYRIIGKARGGSVVEVLQSDSRAGFTRIRTGEGVKGWIATQHLSNEPSGQAQLIEVRQELERLQAQYDELQRYMEEIIEQPGKEKIAYTKLYKEFLKLRQRFAQYRKMSADTVIIDERNQFLEERTIMLERELRVVEQENQALHYDNQTIRMLMVLILVGMGLLTVIFIPRIRAQRRAQWTRL